MDAGGESTRAGSPVLKNSSNQRSEKPGGGKTKKSVEEGGDQHDQDRPEHEQVGQAGEQEEDDMHLSRVPCTRCGLSTAMIRPETERDHQEGEGDRRRTAASGRSRRNRRRG